MNIQLNLVYNLGFSWYESDNIYVKGYAFDRQDRLLTDAKLANYFREDQPEVLIDKVKNLNGAFCIIIINKPFTFVFVDRLRTFPIFYSINDKNVCISDSVNTVMSKSERYEVNKKSTKEFLYSGYVLNNKTLIRGIKQVNAGSYLFINNANVDHNFYYIYYSNDLFSDEINKIQEKFHEVLNKSFNRFKKFARDDQVVVPLSGGYDSRLIVSMLKSFNFKNVLCYTYGKKDNWEVSVSREIARKLNYDWKFIEFDKNTAKDITKDKSFINYYKYSSNFSSIFHLQDYFAVNNLNLNNSITKNSIFLPGHTGDFISGGHLPKIYEYQTVESLENLNEYINLRHMIFNNNLFKKNNNTNFLSGAIRHLNSLGININPSRHYLLYENWEIKERQSKFIINSLRNYEFFGYRHYTPLWDNDLIEFFLKLKLIHKVNKNFYDNYLMNNIFSKYDIQLQTTKTSSLSVSNIPQTNSISYQCMTTFKKYIKKLLPKILVYYIQKKRKENRDYYSFDHLSKPFIKEIGIRNIDLNYTYINHIIPRWILLKYLQEIDYVKRKR